MGLSIINNLPAIQAQNTLFTTNNNISKTLQRLSTGLSINTASDNPSGLAISERLRTQINGFERASANAQDAISFLQTAEGALNETHSVLQRMRELAVQAANGVLTANDRQEIQKEVDQLSEEVDRIAKSTEFNTRKLLEGSGAALWSASNDDIEAVINGKVAEGNYKLEISNAPGKNQVIKTDIFSYKAGMSGIANADLGNSYSEIIAAVSAAADGDSAITTNLVFNMGSSDHTISVTIPVIGASAGTTNTAVASQIAAAINADTSVSTYIQATANTAAGSLKLQALTVGSAPNSWTVRENTTVDSAEGNLFTVIGTAAGTLSGGQTNLSGITNISDAQNMIVGTSYSIDIDDTIDAAVTGTATLLGTYLQSTSNVITAFETLAISAAKTSGYLMMEVTNGGLVSCGAVTVKVSTDEGQTWYAGSVAAGGSADITIGSFAAGNFTFEVSANMTLTSGDKFLIGINGNTSASTSYESYQFTVSTSLTSYNNISKDGPIFYYSAGATENTITQHTVGYLNSTTGEFRFGTVDITAGYLTASGSYDPTFDVTGTQGVAMGQTKLSDIDRFYDANGNFVLGDNGKYITLYNQKGSSTKIYIDGGDTLLDVVDKIKTAITTSVVDGGMGMATDVANVDSNVASFVGTATANTDEAVQGTIVIRSSWQGKDGQLYFSADENVLNALSLATVQDPSDYNSSAMTVNVYNAHTGTLAGSDTVTDGILHNVIEGVDVKMDPNVDVTPSWNTTTKSFDFASSSGDAVRYLHVVDKTISFQVGANEGQTTGSYIAQMDAKALGVDNVLMIDQNLAQSAITQIDNAIQSVSSERARIGGTINRLDHTINNLAVQEENQLAAESTIRDVDMAKAVSEMTKQQILMQTATAMLAQANQVPQTLLGLLR